MSKIYRQTCINGHPATVSPDNGKPWRCGDPECEFFDGADDTALGVDLEPTSNLVNIGGEKDTNPRVPSHSTHRLVWPNSKIKEMKVSNDALTDLLVWAYKQGFLDAAQVLTESVKSLDDAKIRAQLSAGLEALSNPAAPEKPEADGSE
jgi:hypothetical protein